MCQRVSVILFLMTLVQPGFSHQPEDGKVTITFGPHLQRTYVPAHFNTTMSTYLGFGLLAEGDIDRSGGLEMGIFYMKKSYFQYYHGTEVVEQIRRIHIPVGYRHWWNKRVSSGLGFYSSYSIGDPRPLENVQVPAGFDSAARRATKYGFDFSMLWDVLEFDEYILVLDGRLSLALSPKSGEHSSHYGLMCGLKFNL